MKDFIVLISSILLGVALAGFVIGFKDSADTIKEKAVDGITDAFSAIELEIAA